MKRIAWCALAVAGSASAVFGQAANRSPSAPRPAVAERESKDVGVRLRLDGQHAFRADLDDRGDVAVTRLDGELGLDFGLTETLRLTTDWRTERSWYDFDNATGFVAGFSEPWDDVIEHELGVGLLGRIDERWSWFARGFVNSAGEDSADFGSTITGGGAGGLRYAFSETFALSFGALGRSRLEDDAIVIPIIGVNWTISEKLRFDTRGLGARLSYQLTEPVGLFLQGGYESREFRLDDEGAAPEGVGRDARAPIAAGIAWRPNPNFALEAFGGYQVWQEFELLDGRGNRLAEIESDPAPIAGVSLEIRF